MGTNGQSGAPARRGGVSAELSFEFFPPQTAQGRARLLRTAQALGEFQPSFYSVTYGAGGSTRDRTYAAVCCLADAGLRVAPHLSWGGDSAERILALVADYRQRGIRQLVALRGDVPSGLGPAHQVRHAEALVRLLRAEAEGPLTLAVAAYPEVHPEAPSAEADIAFLKRKVEAGADLCITQYFYNADGYFYFRDRCRAAGIEVPVVPGVMPIANYPRLLDFSAKAGAEIPRWMRQRLDRFGEDRAALRTFADEVVTALCERLLRGGAPGLHFYTLNNAAPTTAVLANLRLPMRDVPCSTAVAGAAHQ